MVVIAVGSNASTRTAKAPIHSIIIHARCCCRQPWVRIAVVFQASSAVNLDCQQSFKSLPMAAAIVYFPIYYRRERASLGSSKFTNSTSKTLMLLSLSKFIARKLIESLVWGILVISRARVRAKRKLKFQLFAPFERFAKGRSFVDLSCWEKF